MRDVIRKVLREEIKNNKVICDGCGWTWNLSEGGDDPYICHKCGHDNSPKKSNFDVIFDNFSQSYPENVLKNLDVLKKVIQNYISKSGINIKFLPSCNTMFKGVRTKDQVIICAPSQFDRVGDFLYTLFHEIRHEQQISQIKMTNPISEMDLEDFENLYKQYWEMELDADQFAKNMVAQLVLRAKIPMDFAKSEFSLSPHIEKYPTTSKFVESSLQMIINIIRNMKKRGENFEDIQDIPMVKQHLQKLENLF